MTFSAIATRVCTPASIINFLSNEEPRLQGGVLHYLRGEASVYDFLATDQDIDLTMSTITMMELMAGALNKREVQRIQKAFKKIKIVFINEDISKTAQDLVQTYTKSHNLQIADALIAATALYLNITLITYNKSDFKYIPNLTLFG